MPEISPSHFDLVILGTGLQAALLAGRAALAGKTVLHLDQADHYGAAWSTLTWEQMQRLHALPQAGSLSQISSGTADDADLGRLSSYAFDLALRVLYCAGPAIEALVKTGAHHYLEFKLIAGNYFWNESRLQSVPAGRADVFQDRSLSLTSKRMLMRFLKNLQDAIEGRGPLKDAFDDRPFSTLLKQQGLDEQLQHVLLHAIALSPWSKPEDSSEETAAACSTGTMTAAEGQRALAQHAASMGRFGPGTGAFLTPLYGGSEMSQAFCRVAAVHGALYVLRQPIDALIMDPETAAQAGPSPNSPWNCRGVRLTTGQEITCGALAADPGYLQGFRRSKAPGRPAAVSRAICVLDKPLQVGGQQVLMTFPPGSFQGSCQHAVHALQLSPACALTPPDRYLLQLSAPASNPSSAASDFMPVLNGLLEVPPEVRQGLTTPRPPASPPDSVPPHVHSSSSQEATCSSIAAGRNLAQACPEIDGAAQLTASSSSHTRGQALDEDLAHAEGNKARPDEPLARTSEASAHDKLQDDASPHRSGTYTSGNDHTAAVNDHAAPTSESQPAAAGVAATSKAQSNRPTCLHALCWTQRLPDPADFDLPCNVAMCSPPDAQISFDAALTGVDALIERLYGAGVSSSWDSQQGLQDDESDEEAVEALSHALEQTAVDS